jgi:UDP-N-acetyl-D-mannosaminuronic acid dehydrogenase
MITAIKFPRHTRGKQITAPKIQMTTQKQYTNDTSPKALEMGKTAAIKKAVNLSEFDVFILCKPADMFSPQTYGLSEFEKISKEAKSGILVSIESTIPKGTSKRLFEILNHRFHVLHASQRWYS